MSFLPPLPPSLDAALRDADASQPAHRWAAALRLREVEDDRRPEALEALRKLQADPVGPIRAAAMEALGAIGEIADRELLLRGLEDEHQEVRRAAVHALARIGEQRCWDALLEALACGPEDLREAVIIALVEHAPRGIPHAAEVIAACLLDADAAIRATAAQALGDLGSQGYRDLLAPLLEDENPEVALAAALALSDLEDPRGSATLIAALEGPFALEAALALYRSGTAEAIAPLARRMPGALGSLMLRAAIGGALHRLGDPRGEEALRTVLRAWRADGRGLAVRIVGEARIASLLGELIALVRRPRGVDPGTLALSLSRFEGHPEAAAALAALIARDGPAVDPALGLPQDAPKSS